MADLFCDIPLNNFEQLKCNNWRYGGISAVAFLDDGETLADPTADPDLDAARIAGTLFIQQPIRGSEPEASAIEGDNPNAAIGGTILDTFTRTIVLFDYNITPANTANYNLLNGNTKKAVLFYGRDRQVKFIDTGITWKVTDPTEPDKGIKRFYTITGTYTRKDMYPTQDYAFPSTLWLAVE